MHTRPVHLLNDGLKYAGLALTPGKPMSLRALANSGPSIHGAPSTWKGTEVPRPSDTLVPSSRQVPGYKRAISIDGALGDVGTQGNPVSWKCIRRDQFLRGTIVGSGRPF